MMLFLFGLDAETKQLIRELITVLRQKSANDELAEAARASMPRLQVVIDDLNVFTPETPMRATK